MLKCKRKGVSSELFEVYHRKYYNNTDTTYYKWIIFFFSNAVVAQIDQ